MVKHNGFISPNGRKFKSQAAYKRSLRGQFASMSQTQRKKFKPQTYFIARKEKSKVTGPNKKDIKGIDIQTVKVTTMKSEKKGDKYVLKEKSETARVTSMSKEDKDGNTIDIIESEESSRYTPSKVEYDVEVVDENVVLIDAKKDGRIVKSTSITTRPGLEESVRSADLKDRFLKYYRTPPKKRKDLPDDVELSVREKVTLAKDFGGIPTGAPTHRKLTPKIKAAFEKNGVVFT